jgi:arabinofuranosyltransferase
VLNKGERVEAATSPLWVAIVALGHVVTRARIEYVAVVVGLVCSVAAMAAASAAAAVMARPDRNSAGPRPLVWAPLGALVYLALPPAWDFATSGLDTSLAVAWLGAAALLLALAAGGRAKLLPTALVIGLGPLVRPDMAVLTAVFLVALVVVDRRRWGITAAAAAAPALVYQVFRMGYYGLVVPNTAIAKEASTVNLNQGLRYLGDTFGTYALLVPLAAAAVVAAAVIAATRRRGASLTPVIAPVAGGLIHGAYITLVGGDFMSSRLLLPSIFAVLIPVMVVGVPRPTRALVQAAVPLAVVAVWAIVCVTSLRVPYLPHVGPDGIADERSFWLDQARHDNPVTVEAFGGLFLARWGKATGLRAARHERDLCFVVQFGEECQTPPGVLDARWHTGAAVAAGNIGVISASAPLNAHIIDLGGLADPLIARQRLRARHRPGHEKGVRIEWVVAKFTSPESPLPAGLDPDLAARTRAALRCHRFTDLEQATTARLTPSRFLKNLVGAAGRSFWRFDDEHPKPCAPTNPSNPSNPSTPATPARS